MPAHTPVGVFIRRRYLVPAAGDGDLVGLRSNGGGVGGFVVSTLGRDDEAAAAPGDGRLWPAEAIPPAAELL